MVKKRTGAQAEDGVAELGGRGLVDVREGERVVHAIELHRVRQDHVPLVVRLRRCRDRFARLDAGLTLNGVGGWRVFGGVAEVGVLRFGIWGQGCGSREGGSGGGLGLWTQGQE